MGKPCLPQDFSEFRKKQPQESPPLADWTNNGTLFIPREEDVQTLQHPVMSPLPRAEKRVKNRFLESMYRKYPHILPKREPVGKLDTLEGPYSELYKSCYTHDYGPRKEKLEIWRNPGVRDPHPDQDKIQFRDPEMPYLPGRFDNSITKLANQNWPYESKPPELIRPTKIIPISSDYNDNYNRMAKLFQKLGVHRKSHIYLKHQNTFPPFEKVNFEKYKWKN